MLAHGTREYQRHVGSAVEAAVFAVEKLFSFMVAGSAIRGLAEVCQSGWVCQGGVVCKENLWPEAVPGPGHPSTCRGAVPWLVSGAGGLEPPCSPRGGGALPISQTPFRRQRQHHEQGPGTTGNWMDW